MGVDNKYCLSQKAWSTLRVDQAFLWNPILGYSNVELSIEKIIGPVYEVLQEQNGILRLLTHGAKEFIKDWISI